MPFKEGAEVKTGDLLFEIDPRPYQAQLDQAQGQVNLYQAQLKLAKTIYARDRAINARVPGAVSKQQLDQDRASVEEADARVKAFEKNMEVYKLNLDFTKVTSPIDGQVSRYYLTLGNLVNQDQTLLTTVVSLDPMYAYFDVDEPTLLADPEGDQRGEDQAAAGPARTSRSSWACRARTASRTRGPSTSSTTRSTRPPGSISVRGVFPNPKPPGGVRLLSPGMFVRIRLPIGQPHPALLVIDRADRVGPGAEVRLRARRREQGPVPPRHDGAAPGGRPARDRRGAASRTTGSSSAACSRSARACRSSRSEVPMPTLGQPTGAEATIGRQPSRPTTQPAGPDPSAERGGWP